MYKQPTSKRASGSGVARRKRGISISSTSSTRAPSIANPLYGTPRPRAVHIAHDCRATPHCSSPPPFVIESPKASTPSRLKRSSKMAGAQPAYRYFWTGPLNLERTGLRRARDRRGYAVAPLGERAPALAAHGQALAARARGDRTRRDAPPRPAAVLALAVLDAYGDGRRARNAHRDLRGLAAALAARTSARRDL